jgi:phosphoribosylglycinamide formyltransferase 1
MKSIVIFASGAGTNVENIITYFSNSKDTSIEAILANNRNAKVLDKADAYKINAFYFNKTVFYHSNYVLSLLSSINPNLIVLSGFLWKLPKNIIDAFPKRIINIHPALLPKYGGKGMYGMHVHNAVVEHKEKETGITIHYVNEHYDKGDIIFQAKITVSVKDTPIEMAKKVHQLEYKHFPKIIEKLLHE